MCWVFLRKRRPVKKASVEDVAIRLVSRLRASGGGDHHHAVKRVSFKQDGLFIDQCREAGIAPEKMIRYLRSCLQDHSQDRDSTEKLLDILRLQLKAEHIQIIADNFQFHSQTYVHLEASCVEWGLGVGELVRFFEQMDRFDLADAVRHGRDCVVK
jgi:hypothetical protein